jgi:hypothetical protein
MEAADLGVRLCQQSARSVYPGYAMVAVPVITLAVASVEIAEWLPSLLIWWSKPWLDRTILVILSRAAFGHRTTIGDVWRARRHAWWSQLVFTLTVQRLSLWRSLTQPVYQLEGGSIWGARPRVRHIRRRTAGSAFLVMQAFSLSEAALTIGLLSLIFWFAPAGHAPDIFELLAGEMSGFFALALPIAYGLSVLFVEPFYVAAGFAMYLNRRAELEAWDIEQKFRRAFAA